MAKVIFTHLYVIFVAIFVVTTANILADQYGANITRTLSSMAKTVDQQMNNVETTVSDWNKHVLD